MTRLVIAGVPKAGKTTHASIARVALGGDVVPVRHTDDLIAMFPGRDGWSAASEYCARSWLTRPGPWIVEGVAAVRALRKWLAAESAREATGAIRGALPCDRVLWLGTPHVVLTPDQARMAKGCETVWRQIRPQLLARGVHVEER